MNNIKPLFFLALLTLLAACASPVITRFSPAYGPPGTEVSVVGQNMTSGGGAPAVDLNGTPQPGASGTPTNISFTVAEGSMTGPIGVTTSSGRGVSTEEFEVVDDFTDGDGTYTFGGTEVQAARVSSSGIDQEVIVGLLRPRWEATNNAFGSFTPDVDAEFADMNEFWKEASFGRVSFTRTYLGNSIIDLPKSSYYYYHAGQQRNIRGSALPASVNFPGPRILNVRYGSTASFNVTFPAGNVTRAALADSINNARTAVTGAPPRFIASVAGNRLEIRAQDDWRAEATMELSGNALPLLGLGTNALYNLGNAEPMRQLFGASVPKTDLTVAADADLWVATLGDTTRISIEAGTVFDLTEVAALLQSAYPGTAAQQPFSVSVVEDGEDPDLAFLHFAATYDATGGDHGFTVTFGGSARSVLGLDVPGILVRHEPWSLNGRTAIQDGFAAFVTGLPGGTDIGPIFQDARMFVGVMVETDNMRAHASSHTFNLDGINFETSYFISRFTDLAPFAHETGHTLGLPDLYPVDANTAVGTVPNNWDIMDCSRCDVHPVQWLKSRHHKEPTEQIGAWIDAGRIATVGPPLGSATKVLEYIISPAESPWISANPFASSHPGIEVVQALELVPTDPKDVFFLENRQKGPFVADHLGDAVDFGTQMPGEGVIAYQARRLPTSGLVNFLPVNLLTPYSDPLNTEGEVFEHIITGMNRINVEVIDRILNPDASAGPPSYSYHIKVTWGRGSFYDLAIREWNPPPWESEDIWIDNRAENDWGVYTYTNSSGEAVLNGDNVAVGQNNRIHARVRNLGDLPVTTDFEVVWRIAVPQVAGGTIETELGRVTVTEDVPANGSIITPALNWQPSGSNEEHICLKAEILPVPGELNGSLNNSAQENLTQWFTTTASPFTPVEVTFETVNPYPDRSEYVELNVPDVPEGWTVTLEDVRFRLPAGGRKTQKAVIRPILGYFQQRGIIKEKGVIPTARINIEAKVPYGDELRVFGGITAIVHPVNKDTRVELDKDNKTDSKGNLLVRGRVVTVGPLSPGLTGLLLNVRMRAEKEETWSQIKTDKNGSFLLSIPPALRKSGIKAKVFLPGGNGLNKASSVELTVPPL